MSLAFWEPASAAVVKQKHSDKWNAGYFASGGRRVSPGLSALASQKTIIGYICTNSVFFWRKSSSGLTAYTHFLKLFYASLHHLWLACLSFFASSVCSTLERIVLKSFFFFWVVTGRSLTQRWRGTPGWPVGGLCSCWRVLGRKPEFIWSYSRAAGCTVSVAGVPFAPLQVNEL